MRKIKFRAWDKEEKRWIPIKDRNWIKHDSGKCEYLVSEFFMDGEAMDCKHGITSFVTLDGLFVDVYPLDGKDAFTTCTFNYGDRFELSQYTGLKDKNGKEIYEGYIVQYWDCEGGQGKGVVEFREGTWIIQHDAEDKKIGIRCFTPVWNFREANCEIIGNIYENPELLTA